MSKLHKMHSLMTIVSLLVFSVTTANANLLGKPAMIIGGKLVAPNGQLPKYYPSEFQETGVIYKIDPRGLTVTGSTEKYTLSPNVLIHTLSTEFSNRNEIRKGRTIGFSFTVNANKQRVITEVWTLPSGALPQL